MTSSPLRPGATLEDELAYYKKQYEQLELDLADFQASSKELEEQLEKDVDTAEKNERKLKEQVEKLGFEVSEWKSKHQQSKTEANSAQNRLESEIKGLREENRGLKGRLRDIEVANDDYERQARNTTSSLEDLESKLNVAIERGVLLEDEMKVGEQEREALRIETQRLRDELGDLKIESEITLEKLRLADGTIARLRSRKPSPLAVETLRTRSPAGSEASGITPSSPTMSTPPSKSASVSDALTPPSPPLSDTPANAKLEPKTPMPPKRRSLLPEAGVTPRAGLYGPRARPMGHSRGPSIASTATSAASDAKAMRPPASKPRVSSRPSGMPETLPRSESLYQMKSLRSRMQKIEERVHSARSKLPAPNNTTPKGSPRTSSALGQSIVVPSSVTVRKTSKRPSASRTSSYQPSEIDGMTDALANGAANSEANTRRRESHVKRLSYGIPRPASQAASERPPSALDRPPSALDRPPSAASRPSSRLSLAGSRPGSQMGQYSSPQRSPTRSSFAEPLAPASSMRQSVSGRPSSSHGRPRSSMTGNYATVHQPGPTRSSFVEPAPPASNMRQSVSGRPSSSHGRPRSSMTGNYATIHGTFRGHRPSASISESRRAVAQSEDSTLSTPSQRTTIEKPATGVFGFKSRQSGGLPQPSPGKTVGRKGSMRALATSGEMRPPPSRRKKEEAQDLMDDVGETY